MVLYNVSLRCQRVYAVRWWLRPVSPRKWRCLCDFVGAGCTHVRVVAAVVCWCVVLPEQCPRCIVYTRSCPAWACAGELALPECPCPQVFCLEQSEVQLVLGWCAAGCPVEQHVEPILRRLEELMCVCTCAGWFLVATICTNIIRLSFCQVCTCATANIPFVQKSANVSLASDVSFLTSWTAAKCVTMHFLHQQSRHGRAHHISVAYQ